MQFKCNPTETKNKTKQQNYFLRGNCLILVIRCHKYLKVDSLRQVQRSKVISIMSTNHIWNLSMAGARLTSFCPLQEWAEDVGVGEKVWVVQGKRGIKGLGSIVRASQPILGSTRNDWMTRTGPLVEIFKCRFEKVTLDQKGALSALKWWEWHNRMKRETDIGGKIEFSFFMIN